MFILLFYCFYFTKCKCVFLYLNGGSNIVALIGNFWLERKKAYSNFLQTRLSLLILFSAHLWTNMQRFVLLICCLFFAHLLLQYIFRGWFLVFSCNVLFRMRMPSLPTTVRLTWNFLSWGDSLSLFLSLLVNVHVKPVILSYADMVYTLKFQVCWCLNVVVRHFVWVFWVCPWAGWWNGVRSLSQVKESYGRVLQ